MRIAVHVVVGPAYTQRDCPDGNKSAAAAAHIIDCDSLAETVAAAAEWKLMLIARKWHMWARIIASVTMDLSL